MWKPITEVESESRPGVKHTISQADTGRYGCTCESYRWSRGVKRCRHIEAYVLKRDIEARMNRAVNEVRLPARRDRRRLTAAAVASTEGFTFRAITFATENL